MESMDMTRVEAVRRNPIFRGRYLHLQEMERDRQYCGHDMEHFLDVARVCWIRVLEENLPIRKDVVYAAALLHDIGKGAQYATGEPHHIVSSQLAADILPQCGYSDEETFLICDAIRRHRVKDETASPLSRILYDADKVTRLCFACNASISCNWPEEKKNHTLTY